ncbi:MAG: Fis family transcriptional regulator [Myxococcales bacterium]|nr:Fis family transcriptional regulator [Myxococcales bacterium]
MAKILIVDDELSMREFLGILLRKQGYEVTSVSSGEEAVAQVDREFYDVVLTDLKMSGMSGLDVLRQVSDRSPGTQVIMMTAYATAETAISALKQGAYDYLTKPFKVDAVKVVMEKAIEKAELVKENFKLKRQIAEQNRFEELVGKSSVMKRLYELIARVAQTKATILITGESGTGKELGARAIHKRSSCGEGPFVPVNCGAIPAELIESELFGHVKGAFTSANRDKMGLFQAAHGGSLFLDEVGELPMVMQVKLLRVLQEKKVKRVGGLHEESVDTRIIAATNRDLRQMVEDGTFREDLYYRLNVIQLDIPPLRERREDIPLLVQHFIRKYCSEHGKAFEGVDEEAMKILLNYPYPGNIRELENIIERMVTLETGEWLTKEGLPYHMMQEQSFNSLADDLEIPEEGLDLERMVERLERNLLVKALRKTGGVRKQAAETLGISFRSMRYRLDKYNISEKDLEL